MNGSSTVPFFGHKMGIINSAILVGNCAGCVLLGLRSDAEVGTSR